MEIKFELPDKMSKMVKIGKDDDNAMVDKRVEVVVVKKDGDGNTQWKTEDGNVVKTDGVKRVIVKKADGTEEVVTEDVRPVIVTKQGDGSTWTSEDGQTTNLDVKKVIVEPMKIALLAKKYIKTNFSARHFHCF